MTTLIILIILAILPWVLVFIIGATGTSNGDNEWLPVALLGLLCAIIAGICSDDVWKQLNPPTPTPAIEKVEK